MNTKKTSKKPERGQKSPQNEIDEMIASFPRFKPGEIERLLAENADKIAAA